jgi:TadE-like protein
VSARLRRRDREAGTVTAELAVALPGVLLLAVALLVTGQAVIGEVRCTDAARAGARLAARGEPDAAVAAEVARLAPRGTQVSIARGAMLVVVSVRSPLGSPAPSWAGLTMRASATASVEATDP